MKFLIVDDDAPIRQLNSLIFEEVDQSCTIFEAANALQAISLFDENQDFDAIITDFEMPGGNGDKLLYYLEDKKYQGKIILMTSLDFRDLPEIQKIYSGNKNFIFIQKPCTFKVVLEKVRSLFNEQNEDEYRRIRISYFLRYNKCLCDIYLRINDQKYLKIINSNDIYTLSDIHKYIDKNLKYLYLKKEDLEKFADNLVATPYLQYVGDLSTDKAKEDLLCRIQQMLRDVLFSVGVDSSVVELVENYEKTFSSINNEPSLKKLLFNLRNKNDYLYEHSFLTASFGTFLLKKLSWYSPNYVNKLCLAALFHDLALRDPKIALAHDLKSEEIKVFSIEEITEFKNHPQAVCDVLKKSSLWDSDVENMILSHHETMDGTGFPGKIPASNLRPLTCLFILAHEFVRLIYRQNFDERSHKDILTYLFNSYNTGNFRDILDALYASLSLNSIYEEN